MSKKSFVKKIFLVLTVAYFSISGGYLTHKAILSNAQYLKPTSQIEADAGFLGADMLVMKNDAINFGINPNTGEYVRLRPNGKDEPIYVTLDQSIDDKLAGYIDKSLDYVEDIFSNINDQYKFKVVSNSEYQQKMLAGKAVIKYQKKDIASSDAAGTCSSGSNKTFIDDILGNDKTNVYITDSVITIDEPVYNSCSEYEVLSILNHEILHCFGLGDVYSGNIDTGSFMSSQNGYFCNLISPNDFRMLYAAYGDKHLDENGNVDYKKLEEIKEKLDQYEHEYYNIYSKRIMNLKGVSNVVKINKNEYNNKSFVTRLKKASEPNCRYIIKLDIEGEKVTFNLYKNDEKIQTSEGNIYYGDHFAILKDFFIRTTNNDNTENNLKSYFYIFKDNLGNFKLYTVEGQQTFTAYKEEYKTSDEELSK